MTEIGSVRDAYRGFVEEVGPRLRLALICAFGPDMGSKATAEALIWGWEHWGHLSEIENRAGHLYGVGERRVPRMRRPELPTSQGDTQSFAHTVPKALEQLSAPQRASVLLVHGYGWTYREAADGLGINQSSGQRHLEQALAVLREQLNVSQDTDLLAEIRSYASQLDEAASPFEDLRPRLPVLVEARRPPEPSGRWALAITAAVIILAVVAAVALLLEFQ